MSWEALEPWGAKPVVILHPDRFLASLGALLGLLFVGIAYLLQPLEPVPALALALLGVGGIAANGIHFLAGASYLRLDSEGLTIVWRLVRTHYRWFEIESFHSDWTLRARSRPAAVSFDLQPWCDPAKGSLGRHFLTRHDRLLPSTYGESARFLTGLLERWRDRFSHEGKIVVATDRFRSA